MSFTLDYFSEERTRGTPERAQKAGVVRTQEKNTQARGGMFGNDGYIFCIYSSLYCSDNNDTYINRGAYLMMDWIINATGEQIVTVVAMIWLTVMLVKIVTEEKQR